MGTTLICNRVVYDAIHEARQISKVTPKRVQLSARPVYGHCAANERITFLAVQMLAAQG